MSHKPSKATRSHVAHFSDKEEGFRVSVKATIGALILVGICSAVTLSTAVLWASGEEALAETRETGEWGAQVCFDNATDSLEDVSNTLLKYSSTAVDRIVVDFFEIFEVEMDKLVKLSTVIHKTEDQSKWKFLEDITPDLWLSMITTEHSGMYSVSVGTPTSIMISVAGNIGVPFPHALIIYNNGSYYPGDLSAMAVTSPASPTPVFPDLQVLPLGPTKNAGWLYISSGRLNASDILWSSVVELGGFIGYSMTHWTPNPSGIDQTEIIHTLTLKLDKISEFLSAIAEDTERDTGADIRIFSCVASSMMRDSWLRLNLPADLAPEADIGLITGVSKGIATNPDFDTTRPPPLGPPPTVHDVNASDPVIRGIARVIDGGYEAIAEAEYGGARLNVDLNGTMVEYFVQVRRYKNPRGIDWWIVTGIEADFVLGRIIRGQAEIKDTISESNAKTKDDVSKDRLIMLLTVGMAVIVLVLGSIILTNFILRPFTKLQDDMKLVAEMQLNDRSAETGSMFFEVRQMQRSFGTMVKNLEDFKAYVPTSVLVREKSCIAPPEGNIALVFTDIEGSTALWEKSPAAMNAALELHNIAMREMIEANSGYEVKTIGDAFMVAFTNPFDALRFCFSVQQELLHEQWSPDLDLPPLHVTHTDGSKHLLWHGLRVRMGMHAGDVYLEDNALTGRSDYRGTTVNKAARLEGKAKAGSICITKEMHENLMSDLGALDDPVVRPHGEQELKGLGKFELCLMVPQVLKERLSPYMYDTPDQMSCSEDRSSLHSESSRSAIVPVTAKKTDLSLSTGVLSVAVCRLLSNDKSNVFEHCNTMVRLAVEAASQTDGVVGQVTGTTITVVWNGSKICKMHSTAALRFAAQLQRRGETIMKIGVSTGPMWFGNVGTLKKRFPTTFGRPLEAAEAAAEHAINLKTFCLLADCTQGNTISSNPAIYPFVRMADIWMDTGANAPIVLLEVLSSKLLATLEDSWGAVTESHPEIDSHNEAFMKALKGDPEGVNQLRLSSMLATDDEPLKRMIDLISSSPNVKPTHRLCVRFTTLPDGVLRNIDVVVHDKIDTF